VEEYVSTRERSRWVISFNFFGTFTTGQFDELVDFSKIQDQDIKDRINWLNRQLGMNGIFETIYDDNNDPLSFSCNPPNSYGAKLIQAYKILGGVPERDMLLRTSDKPVFLTRGVNIDGGPTSGYSDVFSNGRRNRGDQRFDRDLGLRVQRLKFWQLEVIKRKREHLEFKIKRCLDYSDQLSNEVRDLSRMIGSSANRSVDDQIAAVMGEMFTPGAMNVIVSKDKFGKDIGRIGDKNSEEDLLTEDANSLRGLNDGGGTTPV
jgi:hypothetical protein